VSSVLFVLAFVLLAAWFIALAFKVTFGLIHLLLVGAVILFIAAFLRGAGMRPGGRRTAP
jgi:Family of unknown function (DUF5670)